MKTNIFLIIFIILLSSTALFSIEWRWETLADMPTARFGHCAVVYQDKIWIIGGKNEHNITLSSIDCFNLQTEQWESHIADLLHPRFNAAAAVYQDTIFVIGGRNDYQRLSSVEYYDPISEQWKEFAPLNYPREGMTAVAFEGKLYVIGGISRMDPFPVPLDSVEFWDESTKSWQKSSTWQLMKPRVFMQSIVIDSSVYTLGGFWIDEYLDLAERFRSFSGTDLVSPLPRPRFYFSAVAINDTIYVLGGADSSGLLEYVDIYIQAQDFWQSSAIPIITPRTALAAVSYNREIYIFGGINDLDFEDATVLKTTQRLIFSNQPTNVNEIVNNIQPAQYQLLKNHPNPFNSTTTISFEVSTKGHQLQLNIFNIRGEPVRTFRLNFLSPGVHQIQWDGCDENRRTVESGIYLAQLKSDRFHSPVLKLSFIK